MEPSSTTYDSRVIELLRHHADRLDLMRRALEGNPKTPYAISRVVFRGTLNVYERCFALAETLAPLEHLVLENRAERAEDEAIFYRLFCREGEVSVIGELDGVVEDEGSDPE